MGLFGFLVVPAPLALILGIIAVWDIRKSMRTDRPKHGMGRAVFALIIGFLGTALLDHHPHLGLAAEVVTSPQNLLTESASLIRSLNLTSMKKYNVGMIGYGWAAGAHIDSINRPRQRPGHRRSVPRASWTTPS